MRELETEIRTYAAKLDERYADVSAEEILESELVVRSVPFHSSRHQRRLLALAAAVLAVLVTGVLTAVLRPPGQAPVASTPEPPSTLGVFEPFQGRIVYISMGELHGVDPANPSDQVVLEIPDPTPDVGPAGADRLVPAGWSEDGSVLALESEYKGRSYLMDRAGTVTRIPWEQLGFGSGCCWFVTSNWLSPDGFRAAKSGGVDLAIVDLRDLSIESETALEPDEFPGAYVPAWSPDGSEIAFVVAGYVDGVWTPTIQMYDRGEGTLRHLPTPSFGHIRNLAWSPDGKRLLVIAGDFADRSGERALSNPLTRPIATSLYLVDVEGGSARAIADGYYVAAAWSPDGSQIAAVDYPGVHNLVVMNADGSEEQVVAEMPGGDAGLFTGLAWHPIP